MKYAVIEIYERAVESVSTADTYEQAAEIANGLLERHYAALGESEALELIRKRRPAGGPAGNGDGLQRIDPSLRMTNAWTNLHDLAWDAHIVELPEGGIIPCP